jgi:hypothetical protein
MMDVNRWGAHGLAYSYQVSGANGTMTSWVETSSDGQRWSAAQLVTSQSENVHDTAQIPRLDGSVDLYYIYSQAADENYRIYRRHLSLAGTLGPEQPLNDPALKNLEKPFPSRLADGKVLLTFVQATAFAPAGYPTSERMDAVVLDGDAP